jgi:hypothetical protein
LKNGVEVNWVLNTIEKWAAQSDERARLVVIAIWVILAVVVFGGTFVAAELVLPAEWRPL